MARASDAGGSARRFAVWRAGGGRRLQPRRAPPLVRAGVVAWMLVRGGGGGWGALRGIARRAVVLVFGLWGLGFWVAVRTSVWYTLVCDDPVFRTSAEPYRPPSERSAGVTVSED